MNQIFTINNPVLNFLLLTVILTFLILLFGEVIPKLYANSNNLRLPWSASGRSSARCEAVLAAVALLMMEHRMWAKAVSQRPTTSRSTTCRAPLRPAT